MNNGAEQSGGVPLCYKYGCYGHFAVVCSTKGLHFYTEETTPESGLTIRN